MTQQQNQLVLHKFDDRVEVEIDPLLPRLTYELSKSFQEELGEGLDAYVIGLVGTVDVDSLKKQEAINQSAQYGGCVRVLMTTQSIAAFPLMGSILLPLVKNKELKLVMNKHGIYERFLFVNDVEYKDYALSTGFRSEDMSGDMDMTNRVVLYQYMRQVADMAPESVGVIDFVLGEQSNTFTNPTVLPSFKYCTTSGQDGYTLTEAEEYVFDHAAPEVSPKITVDMPTGTQHTISGFADSLGIAYNREIHFANCPEGIVGPLTAALSGLGISSTFFNVDIVYDGTKVWLVGIDFSAAPVYTGAAGILSIDECTEAMRKVFSPVLA